MTAHTRARLDKLLVVVLLVGTAWALWEIAQPPTRGATVDEVGR